MLPEDSKSRKAQIKEKLEETQVNDHFKNLNPKSSQSHILMRSSKKQLFNG